MLPNLWPSLSSRAKRPNSTTSFGIGLELNLNTNFFVASKHHHPITATAPAITADD